MPSLRKTTDLAKLTEEQREAVGAAKKAQQKFNRAKSTYDGALAARDDRVREALELGVGPKMLALQLDVNHSVIWKVRRKEANHE
jgi:hypothetical protein